MALEDELEIADVEGRGAAEFGEAAGGGDEVVDEIVGYLEENLRWVVSRSDICGVSFCAMEVRQACL